MFIFPTLQLQYLIFYCYPCSYGSYNFAIAKVTTLKPFAYFLYIFTWLLFCIAPLSTIANKNIAIVLKHNFLFAFWMHQYLFRRLYINSQYFWNVTLILCTLLYKKPPINKERVFSVSIWYEDKFHSLNIASVSI